MIPLDLLCSDHLALPNSLSSNESASLIPLSWTINILGLVIDPTSTWSPTLTSSSEWDFLATTSANNCKFAEPILGCCFNWLQICPQLVGFSGGSKEVRSSLVSREANKGTSGPVLHVESGGQGQGALMLAETEDDKAEQNSWPRGLNTLGQYS